MPPARANPRSTKLFLNTYSILLAVRVLEGVAINIDTLVLWATIRVRWPSIADRLEHNPDAVKGIHEPLWCSELFPEPFAGDDRSVMPALQEREPTVRQILTTLDPTLGKFRFELGRVGGQRRHRPHGGENENAVIHIGEFEIVLFDLDEVDDPRVSVCVNALSRVRVSVFSS